MIFRDDLDYLMLRNRVWGEKVFAVGVMHRAHHSRERFGSSIREWNRP